MNVLAYIGATLSILVGGGATLCWMGFILAGMPNSSPAQEASLWRFFWGVAAGGIVCAAGAIALTVLEKPGWGILAGATPVAALLVFFILAIALPS